MNIRTHSWVFSNRVVRPHIRWLARKFVGCEVKTVPQSDSVNGSLEK